MSLNHYQHTLSEPFDIFKDVSREQDEPPPIRVDDIDYCINESPTHDRIQTRRRLVKEQDGRPEGLGRHEGDFGSRAV